MAMLATRCTPSCHLGFPKLLGWACLLLPFHNTDMKLGGSHQPTVLGWVHQFSCLTVVRQKVEVSDGQPLAYWPGWAASVMSQEVEPFFGLAPFLTSQWHPGRSLCGSLETLSHSLTYPSPRLLFSLFSSLCHFQFSIALIFIDPIAAQSLLEGN